MVLFHVKAPIQSMECELCVCVAQRTVAKEEISFKVLIPSSFTDAVQQCSLKHSEQQNKKTQKNTLTSVGSLYMI